MIESDFDERIVTSALTGADNEIEESLRPRRIGEYIGPVSYTHLDVYKGQVLS